MNTFPYENWEEAIQAAIESEGATGYFTWGPGGNTASYVLSIVGIAISVAMALLVTMREDKLLNDAADRLADKYN